MQWIVVVGYGLSMLVICVFSLEQLYLTLMYRRHRSPRQFPPLHHFPTVTVQLPVYNERYVVERLLDAVCALDYPADRLEIQVLDDSTDDTSALIAAKAQQWQQRGLHVIHLRRPTREGFKAGALQFGLEQAQGEYIAIFDADFLPNPDFLHLTLPAFTSAQVGMVQTRWGHVNEDFNWLTRVQAFGLNAHFTIEQSGRNRSGKLMNFNGTAGIWRKACIVDAGGWEYDTLTEDLDLSYRAQLRGWQFEYLEQVVAPAELPVMVPAVKSQQYRWNKGAAETARKNLCRIWSSSLPWSQRFHATMHLLNSSVFVFLLLAALLSVPMLYLQQGSVAIGLLYRVAAVFFIGFIGMFTFYWVSARATVHPFSIFRHIRQFVIFLSLSMGLALHNAIAVVEGYLGIRTPFVRTPKFNVRQKGDSWRGNVYLKQLVAPSWWMEGLLALYFLFGLWSAVHVGDYAMALFHLMLSVGFGAVFLLSWNSLRYAAAK